MAETPLMSTQREHEPASASRGIGRASLMAAGRRLGMPLLFVLVPAIVAWEFLTTRPQPSVLGSDFRGTLWNAAGALLEGRSPYPTLGSAAVESGNPAVYPPFAMLVVAPLRLLGWHTALALWLVVLVAAAVAGLHLLGVRDWRLYPLVLVSIPVMQGVLYSNITLLLLFGVGIAWRYRERPGISGLAIGVIVAAKLFLWPLGVWLLLTRRFRSAFAAACWAVGLVIVPWAAIGFDGLRDYPRLLGEVSDYYGPRSMSLLALGDHIGLSEQPARVLPLVGGIVVLAIAAVVSRREVSDRRVFALCVLAAVVASPIVWGYYLTLLFVPVLMVRPRLDVVAALAVALWIVLSPAAVWGPLHLPPWTTTTVAVAGLFAVVAWFVSAATEPYAAATQNAEVVP